MAKTKNAILKNIIADNLNVWYLMKIICNLGRS